MDLNNQTSTKPIRMNNCSESNELNRYSNGTKFLVYCNLTDNCKEPLILATDSNFSFIFGFSNTSNLPLNVLFGNETSASTTEDLKIAILKGEKKLIQMNLYDNNGYLFDSHVNITPLHSSLRLISQDQSIQNKSPLKDSQWAVITIRSSQSIEEAKKTGTFCYIMSRESADSLCRLDDRCSLNPIGNTTPMKDYDEAPPQNISIVLSSSRYSSHTKSTKVIKSNSKIITKPKKEYMTKKKRKEFLDQHLQLQQLFNLMTTTKQSSHEENQLNGDVNKEFSKNHIHTDTKKLMNNYFPSTVSTSTSTSSAQHSIINPTPLPFQKFYSEDSNKLTKVSTFKHKHKPKSAKSLSNDNIRLSNNNCYNESIQGFAPVDSTTNTITSTTTTSTIGDYSTDHQSSDQHQLLEWFDCIDFDCSFDSTRY